MGIINVIGASKTNSVKSLIIILCLFITTTARAEDTTSSDLEICSNFDRIANKNRQVVEKKMKQLMGEYPLPKSNRLGKEEALAIFLDVIDARIKVFRGLADKSEAREFYDKDLNSSIDKIKNGTAEAREFYADVNGNGRKEKVVEFKYFDSGVSAGFIIPNSNSEESYVERNGEYSSYPGEIHEYLNRTYSFYTSPNFEDESMVRYLRILSMTTDPMERGTGLHAFSQATTICSFKIIK